MSVQDPKRAYEILDNLGAALAAEVREGGPMDTSAAINALAMGMTGSGVSLSSLDEAQWIEVLRERFGVEPGEEFEYMEQLAEWSAGD